MNQWGNSVYNVAARLEPTHGDPQVRAWFARTMENAPDKADTPGGFIPLDRFVMELFRTINPNEGSLSRPKRTRQLVAVEFNSVATPHLAASMSPQHWDDPTAFNPDRYKTATTSADNDEAKAKQAGLCSPFHQEPFPAKDGRAVKLTNSTYGAVYSEIEGTPHPVVDTAGYAPFGFGYRRCAGEHLTMEFVKEFLRKVWRDKLSFVKLSEPHPGQVPVNPRTVLNDDIAFRKGDRS